jgi:bifunctional DNA-binding transcriptional regulator/antitoxin component of YhaV-PrlF toxin-antitoxin module
MSAKTRKAGVTDGAGSGIIKKFHYKLEAEDDGDSVAAIRPPFDVKEVFGKVRVPICGTINGHPYRTTIAHMGGESFIGISKALREAAGVNIGDTIEVTVQFDTAERTVDVPDDLAVLLKRNPKAQDRFESSSYTHRKEFVQWITSAKRPETRKSRLERTIEMLLKKQHL